MINIKGWREGIILLFCVPFLLFPTQFPLITAVSLLLVAITWLYPLFRTKKSLLPSTPLNLLLLLWGITFLVGALVTADPLLTLPKTTGLLLGFAVWRYLLRTIHSQQHLYYAFWGFTILGLGLTFIGTFSTNWLFKIPLIATLLQRLSLQILVFPEAPNVGTHTNQLAATILLFWPLLLVLIASRRQFVWPKVVWWSVGATAVFTTLILILTQSRSSWVGALASIGFLLFCWHQFLPASRLKLLMRNASLVALGMLLLLVIFIGPRTIQAWWLEPPDESLVGSFASLNLRQEIWPWALTAIQDFPFTGIGLGAFRQAGLRLYPLNLPLDYDIGHAHNIFLQVALDLGLLGLSSYLGILLVVGWMAWRVAKHDEAKRPLALGLLAGLIALHIQGLADALAPGAKPGVLFWYNISLITILFQTSFSSRN